MEARFAPATNAKQKPLAWASVPLSLKSQLVEWLEMLIEANSCLESTERKARFRLFTDSFVQTDVGVRDRDAFSYGLSEDASWAGRLLGEIAQCAAGESLEITCVRKKKQKTATKKRRGKKAGQGPIMKVILAFCPLSPKSALARYMQLSASDDVSSSSNLTSTSSASTSSPEDPSPSSSPIAIVEANASKLGNQSDSCQTTQTKTNSPETSQVDKGTSTVENKHKKQLWREVAFTFDEKRERWSAEG